MPHTPDAPANPPTGSSEVHDGIHVSGYIQHSTDTAAPNTVTRYQPSHPSRPLSPTPHGPARAALVFIQHSSQRLVM